MMSMDAYEVLARNIATASENKIHDDEVARRLGFAGGLVVGVEVYAYMTRAMISRYGRAWLDHGTAECRFLKPVYDGEFVRVSMRDQEGGVAVEAVSKGELCAAGAAAIAKGSGRAPMPDDVPYCAPPQERPAANADKFAPGTIFCTAPAGFDQAALAAYLEAVSEREPVYAAEGLVHPGMILRLANQALMENVRLGPWIHAGSRVRNFAAARLGEELTLRTRVKANYENKGHAFVELGGIAVADGRRTLCEIHHTAIWRPRQNA
jgi:acyl dehydratase